MATFRSAFLETPPVEPDKTTGQALVAGAGVDAGIGAGVGVGAGAGVTGGVVAGSPLLQSALTEEFEYDDDGHCIRLGEGGEWGDEEDDADVMVDRSFHAVNSNSSSSSSNSSSNSSSSSSGAVEQQQSLEYPLARGLGVNVCRLPGLVDFMDAQLGPPASSPTPVKDWHSTTTEAAAATTASVSSSAAGGFDSDGEFVMHDGSTGRTRCLEGAQYGGGTEYGEDVGNGGGNGGDPGYGYDPSRSPYWTDGTDGTESIPSPPASPLSLSFLLPLSLPVFAPLPVSSSPSPPAVLNAPADGDDVNDAEGTPDDPFKLRRFCFEGTGSTPTQPESSYAYSGAVPNPDPNPDPDPNLERDPEHDSSHDCGGFDTAFLASPQNTSLQPLRHSYQHPHRLAPTAPHPLVEPNPQTYVSHHSATGTYLTLPPEPPYILTGKRRKREPDRAALKAGKGDGQATADDTDFTTSGMDDVEAMLTKRAHTVPLPSMLTLRREDLSTREGGNGGVRVIGQYDCRFVVVKMGPVLVAVDQHAADERVKLEALLATPSTNGTGTFTRHITGVLAPVKDQIVQVTPGEYQTMVEQRSLFEDDWRFRYETVNPTRSLDQALEKGLGRRVIDEGNEGNEDDEDDDHNHDAVAPPRMSYHLRVTQVPVVFGEPLTAHDLVEFVRTVSTDALTHTPRSLFKPPSVPRIAASMACKAAIKFSDALTFQQCEELMAQLATTQLPFQCAHGRPSCVPLLQMQ